MKASSGVPGRAGNEAGAGPIVSRLRNKTYRFPSK